MPLMDEESDPDMNVFDTLSDPLTIEEHRIAREAVLKFAPNVSDEKVLTKMGIELSRLDVWAILVSGSLRALERHELTLDLWTDIVRDGRLLLDEMFDDDAHRPVL